MDWFVTVALAYMAVLGSVLFVALCGRNALFEGSVVEQAHSLLSGDWLQCVATDAHALRATQGLTRFAHRSLCPHSVEQRMCQQKHHALTTLYLCLVGGCYWLFVRHVFALLPTVLTPAWHMCALPLPLHSSALFYAWGSGALILCCFLRYAGSVLVAVTLVFWALATFSDPGRITPQNHAAWTTREPPGNYLFPEKVCWTCERPRPGRSKHCSLCGACIARHDHHCAWINSCVGANNLRWFLGFLLSNCIMCSYGALLTAATMLGHMWRRGLADAEYWDRATGAQCGAVAGCAGPVTCAPLL